MRSSHLSQLDPNDPADAAVINRAWLRSRRKRSLIRGWVRVGAVITTYLILAGVIIALVYLIALTLLAVAAGTN